EQVLNHKNIELRAECVTSLDQIPRPCVIATGPLTDDLLAKDLSQHFGDDFLYFFDAIAPIIDTESIDMSIAWKANRYDDGEGDYINCPLDKEQYFRFIEDIKSARKIEPK